MGIKIFECQICGYRAFRKNFRRHIGEMHARDSFTKSSAWPKEAGEKKFIKKQWDKLKE